MISQMSLYRILGINSRELRFNSEIKNIRSRILHDNLDSKEKVIQIIQKVFTRTMGVKLSEERLTDTVEGIYSVLNVFKEGAV